MKPVYYEDIELNRTRTTSGRTITEADIVIHAGHTGDFYPHHVDAEWTKTNTPFKQRIAHGTMTFAIGVGLKANTQVNEASFSYGYDRLRFIKPVMIGDTIRTRTRVIRKEDDPKRPELGRVIKQLEVLNQRDEVVLACEEIGLVQRRPC